MVDVLPLLAAVGVIVLWCLGLYGLQRRGLLEPHGLQPSPPPAGPFLMWKTVRGRQLIDRLRLESEERHEVVGEGPKVFLRHASLPHRGPEGGDRFGHRDNGHRNVPHTRTTR